MAEKVKVIQISVKGQYQGKDFFTVTLDDGRTGTCWDEKIKDFVNKEVEIDIREKEYKDEKQLIFNFPKAFKGKNYALEGRKVALSCAVELAAMGRIEIKDINAYADNFLKYLTNG